ncbi:hypothetical protein GCM10018773_02960 [Streptomyces candidus]|nr:hypothetical protein GCM10018773_02960 [Streptomyces candidus]
MAVEPRIGARDLFGEGRDEELGGSGHWGLLRWRGVDKSSHTQRAQPQTCTAVQREPRHKSSDGGSWRKKLKERDVRPQTVRHVRRRARDIVLPALTPLADG